MKIDGKVEKEGSIFEDFDPPFNPPKMMTIRKIPNRKIGWTKQIPDQAKKPDDWDERADGDFGRRRDETGRVVGR